MLKFAVIVLFLLSASFFLNFLSLEQEKYYKEPVERKNTEIYPFYELWAYIAVPIAALLAVSTVVCMVRKKPV